MATKKYHDNCGGLKPIMKPRLKGDKDPNVPMSQQKKSAPAKKKVKRK